MVDCLRSTIGQSDRYECQVVSATLNSKDAASRRLLQPSSWLRRSIQTNTDFEGASFPHFGANVVELETQRYRPRRELTSYLNQFDIVQVVAGSPAFIGVASRVQRPICLQVATMVKWERETLLGEASGPHAIARALMTRRVMRLDEAGFRYADRILVENPTMLAEVRRLGFDAVLAPPGVDTAYFVPSRARPEQPYVLTVGRLDDPRKNVGLLIRSFASMKQRTDLPHMLLLAGQTPPRQADLNLVAALGLEDQVAVLTDVTREDLRELYQGASAFALTSNEEGLGLVVIEAMASGLPIVATRTAGTSYSLADPRSGHLVDPGPGLHERFASALLEVLTCPGVFEPMAEHARRVAVERFSLEAVQVPFLQAYDELTA